MTELATAYVSIVGDASGVPKEIKKAFGEAEREAGRSGQSMGDRMSGALGKTLKRGAIGVATAAGGLMATALVKGFSRLNAIDQATSKMDALKMSTEQVDGAMASALQAVKGTSFGLEEAAGAAATAAAAGVELGTDMDRYLTIVADAAAVGGASMSEMGAIFGKVAGKQKLDLEVVNQLLDRQIGILPALAEKNGTTVEKISKDISAGKVSFEEFTEVMEDMVGGGAEKMGQTFSGALANMGAALGRLGAEAQRPVFDQLPAAFGSITDAIDAATPKVAAFSEALASKVFEEWAPKVKAAFDEFRQTGHIERVQSVLEQLGSALADAAPHLGDLVTGLGKASAALGVSGWQLFLTAIEAGTGVLQILNPLLSTTADLVEDNTGLVAALLAGWLAFKTIPGVIKPITSVLDTLTSNVKTGTTQMKTMATTTGALAEAGRFGKVEMGRFGTSIHELGRTRPIIDRMQTSFLEAAAGADRFGRMAGTASAIGTGFKGVAGGIVTALGGPVGAGLTALTIGAGWAMKEYSDRQQEAAEAAARHKQEVEALTDQVNGYTGALTEAGQVEVYEQLRGHGAYGETARLQAEGYNVTSRDVTRAGGGDQAALDRVNPEIDRAMRESLDAAGVLSLGSIALEEYGVSVETVIAAIRGYAPAQEEMNAAMAASAEEGDSHEVMLDWETYAEYLDDTGRAARDLSDDLALVRDTTEDAAASFRDQDEALGRIPKRVEDIAKSFEGKGKGHEIKLDTTEVAGAEELLTELGFTVEDLGDGQVSITADTDEAVEKLQQVAENTDLLDRLVAIPGVELDDQSFSATSLDAWEELSNLDKTKVDPEAGLIIDALLDGKDVSMAELATLDQTTAKPLVDLLIEKLLANAASANEALDQTARERTATIKVQIATQQEYRDVHGNDGYGNSVGNTYSHTPRRRAHGGIDGLTEPTIKRGSGAGDLTWTPNGPVRWAEGETFAETFIPWAPSKRGRSTELLAATADAFGYELLPKDALPDSISGRLGAITGNITSALVQSTGVDNVRAYADGGILRELAQGQHGASRPLTGAPYDWGGVNWGDCSGAMSAFARAAAGLPIFGGRFSTGTMAADIQAMGGRMGRGGSGDLRFGWVNGGPGGGHTAGTLPTGENVEMGGGYGGGMLGGSVGADDPQFTHHAYFPIRPEVLEWYVYGTDDGGYVTRPDGTVVPRGRSGTFGGGPSGADAGGTSISGRFGAAAGAFVEGHLADIFQTLSINDTPGVLGAIAEYENTQRDPNVAGVDETKLQGDFERARLEQRQQFENEELQRRQEHEAELAELERRRESKALSEEEYDRLAAELKAEFDRTELEKKQEFERAELDAERQLDSARRAEPDRSSAPPLPPGVTDPGMHAPGEGEDIGPDTDSAASVLDPHPIKNAVMQALQPRGWHTGDHWAATEWIKDKESGPDWDNVDATNGQYFGLFQLGDEAWRAAGLEKSTDGHAQGESYGHYVDGRYEDPVQAKQAWEHQGWYDVGGRLREGTTLVHNGLGHEETVLPFRPEDLKASLDGGGEIADKLDQLIGLLMSRPQEVHNNTFRDERAYHDAVKRRSRSRMAAAGGGRL